METVTPRGHVREHTDFDNQIVLFSYLDKDYECSTNSASPTQACSHLRAPRAPRLLAPAFTSSSSTSGGPLAHAARAEVDGIRDRHDLVATAQQNAEPVAG